MPRATSTSIARLLTLTSAAFLLLLTSAPRNTFAIASALPQPTSGSPTEAFPADGTANWSGLSRKSAAGPGGDSAGGGGPRPLSSFGGSSDDSSSSSSSSKGGVDAKPFKLDSGNEFPRRPKKPSSFASNTTPSSSTTTPAFKYNPPKDRPKTDEPSTGMGSSTNDGLGATGGDDTASEGSGPALSDGPEGASAGNDVDTKPASGPAAGAPQSAQALLKSALANIRAPKPAKKAAYALAFHGSASCGGTLLGVAINDEPTPKDGCATVVKADGVTVAKARSASVWTRANGFEVQWFAEAGCKKPVTTSPEKSEGKFSRNGGACESPSGSGGFSYYKVVKA